MDNPYRKLDDQVERHLKKLLKREKKGGDRFKVSSPIAWLKSIGTLRLQSSTPDDDMAYVAQTAGTGDIIYVADRAEMETLSNLLIAKPDDRCTKISTHLYNLLELLLERKVSDGEIRDVWILSKADAIAEIYIDRLYDTFAGKCRRIIWVDL